MKKRLVVCLDGTWQNIVQHAPTNISHIAQSIAPFSTDANGAKTAQVTFYSRGVGATAETGEKDFWERITGGGFGNGLEEIILGAFIFLSLNYEPGDDIFIFGFSRGAYTARSLAGMLGDVGLLNREDVSRAGEAFDIFKNHKPTPEEQKERAGLKPFKEACHNAPVEVTYLGVFDTVGMRGIPTRTGMDLLRLNKKYEFLNKELGTHVRSARQACALDEQRNTLPLTPWTNLTQLNRSFFDGGGAPHSPDAPYQQKWFPGQHGDVGGGIKGKSLSNIPMRWILDGAQRCGLTVLETPDAPSARFCRVETCNPLEPVTPLGGGFMNLLGTEARRIELWNRGDVDAKGNPKTMDARDCATPSEVKIHLHPATTWRIFQDKDYYSSSKPLKQFLGLPAPNILQMMFGAKRKQSAHDVLVASSEEAPTETYPQYELRMERA